MEQFKLPKAEGDPEDAELALFVFPGGGSVQANLGAQEKKFEIPAGKKPEDVIKVEKIKSAGKTRSIRTYRHVPEEVPAVRPEREDHQGDRTTGSSTSSSRRRRATHRPLLMTLLGPAKTIEKHKKAFDEWVKNFK